MPRCRRSPAEDWSAQPPAAVGDDVVELRRLIDGLEGVWSRLVAVLDGSGSLPAEIGTAAWLRSACRMSPGAARRRVVLARRLAERPAVDADLVAGDISVDHAQLVTTALAELEEAAGAPLAGEATAPLLGAGRRCDPARLRREIAHARHALTPVAAGAADEAAHQRRHLDVATTFDGTVVVTGVLDAEGGEALLTALAPLSGRAGPDDDRSPGRRRADGLVELCRRALDGGTLPAAGGERPHLTVLVPLTALQPRPEPISSRPAVPDGPGWGAGAGGVVRPVGSDPGASSAETVWGAVLGAEAARRLACDASVTRVVLDPASRPLDVGRRSRVVPAAIRTALVVRDRGCAFPGCDRPPPLDRRPPRPALGRRRRHQRGQPGAAVPAPPPHRP